MSRVYRSSAIDRAGGKRFVRGDVGFRKLLKNIDPAAREEMGDILKWGGATLRWLIQADTPVKSGALRAAISWKLATRSLRLQVGILGKRTNSNLFYRWIIERGRKAQTVKVHRLTRAQRAEWDDRISAGTARRARKSTDLGVTYDLKVKARAARPFVFAKRPRFRRELGERLKRFWERTLAAAAEGVSDD